MKEIKLSDLSALFWDFDGVIIDSNAVRDNGFAAVLKEFPIAEVNQLLDFHQANGGLSRYVKFRYFFETIRGESITEEEIGMWAEKFSVIMKQSLLDSKLLISPIVSFIKANHELIPMYIVSGSDQTELRFLCKAHGIDHYFKRIHGSPTPKKQWVKEILLEEKLNANNCMLIGDSVNDYDAAIENNLHFLGYNSKKAESLSTVTFFGI